MTAIPTEVVEAALDAMEKGNIDARQPYNEDDKRLMLAALTAAFPKLIENARKDAELLRRYHSWCEHNGCPPSASDLYNPDALSVPLPEIEGGDKGDGWQLVPIEPTPEMLGAWYRYKNGHHWPDEPPPRDTSDYGAYRAMLAAAPSASIEGETP